MKIGFIGAGNMGKALALAVIKKAPKENIYISNRTPEKAKSFAEEQSIVFSSNNEIAKECKYIFLGVKPQMMAEMLSEISGILKERKDRFILVSMAAGLTTEKIADMAGGDFPVIRIMPNTPVSVSEGMVLICSNENVTESENEEFASLISESCKTDFLAEELFDAGSAVSGCGPAFVYMFADALAKGGAEAGLPYEKALFYAEQTVLGAAKLALISKEAPDSLREKVCSPGGSTIEGVKSFWNDNLEDIVKKAVKASYNRTKELGK